VHVTKDRYHHGQLREALLDAAEALAGERGADGWSVREVSAQLGVAPSAAYHHFACREELVSKLAERIQADVGQRLSRAVARADTTDPMQPLIAYARTYVRWTIDNPGLAALAFAAARHIDLQAVISPHPYDILATELDRLVDTAVLNPAARPGAEFMVWPAVHGLAVLCADGMIRHRNRRTTDLEAERLVRALVAGLNEVTTPAADLTAATSPHAERVAKQHRATSASPREAP
jgi:AcrR family transcriptional regulator